MNLPNKLTISRIVLTIAFLVFLFAHGIAYRLLAFLTFILASLTDFLDGFIAKRTNQITDFGKLMDPIADKILVLAAFLAFVELKIVPAWMVIIIIFREVAITGLRALALAKGRVIAADGAGKHKTVSQVLSIFIILVYLIMKEGGVHVFRFWDEGAEAAYRQVIFICMAITVILTLASGLAYMVKNRGVYSNAKKD